MNVILTLLLAASIVSIALLLTRNRRALRRYRKRARRLRSANLDLRASLQENRSSAIAAGLKERGVTSKLPFAFRSQYGEDLFLWDLFEDQVSGKYLEVGAYDGVQLAVTYAFEAIGWTGTLIEPLPDMATACRENRPHSRVVQAAVSRAGSSGTTMLQRFEGEEQAGMLSTLNPTRAQEKRAKGLGPEAVPGRLVEVPLTTVSDILSSEGSSIDFAVVDVEGTELDLLDGFDLKTNRPQVFLVEENERRRNDPLGALMEFHGYVEVSRLAINRVFVRNDNSEFVARAEMLARDHERLYVHD